MYFSLKTNSFLTKLLRTGLVFSSFKGLTHAYLAKTSMTHNKNLTNQFLEDNDHILAKSVAQILPSKLKYPFSFLDFLITGLHIYYLSTFAPHLLVVLDTIFLSKT